jgi:hypothetical protein
MVVSAIVQSVDTTLLASLNASHAARCDAWFVVVPSDAIRPMLDQESNQMRWA